ncbi:MAG: PadR family transcriptional regulator [Solirubrobacteraceae bacterium]
MKLSAPSYLMLGMVGLGMRSGYAIKKAADISTRFFWTTSLAQVYPELARLHGGGLLGRREDPHGARPRDAYEITPQGEAALVAWLRSYTPDETPLQFRDEGALRLFFADALKVEDQLALIRKLRERARNAEHVMRREIIAAAETLENDGKRFPAPWRRHSRVHRKLARPPRGARAQRVVLSPRHGDARGGGLSQEGRAQPQGIRKWS